MFSILSWGEADPLDRNDLLFLSFFLLIVIGHMRSWEKSWAILFSVQFVSCGGITPPQNLLSWIAQMALCLDPVVLAGWVPIHQYKLIIQVIWHFNIAINCRFILVFPRVFSTPLSCVRGTLHYDFLKKLCYVKSVLISFLNCLPVSLVQYVSGVGRPGGPLLTPKLLVVKHTICSFNNNVIAGILNTFLFSSEDNCRL